MELKQIAEDLIRARRAEVRALERLAAGEIDEVACWELIRRALHKQIKVIERHVANPDQRTD